MKTKKSVIFILIGLYAIIFGAFSIFLDTVNQINNIRFVNDMEVPFYFNGVFWFINFILALNMILFIGGIAFLLRKIWGKILIQIHIIVNIILSLYLSISFGLQWIKLDEYHKYEVFKSSFSSEKSFLVSNLFELGVLVVIFYLITRPKIKEQFK